MKFLLGLFFENFVHLASFDIFTRMLFGSLAINPPHTIDTNHLCLDRVFGAAIGVWSLSFSLIILIIN